MPTTRCPVVRPQAGWAGEQGFTTDYHDWSGIDGCCKFCGVSRRAAHVDVEMRPTRLGWQGLEVDRVRREFEAILASRPTPPGLPFAPNSRRWCCVTSLMQRGAE